MLQHITRLITTPSLSIQIDTDMLREPIPNSTYKTTGRMLKSTWLAIRVFITQPLITTLTLLLITTEPHIIMQIPTIITMGIFITLTTMVHTEERITGIHTGGMLTFN
jgi:hypothetical protein